MALRASATLASLATAASFHAMQPPRATDMDAVDLWASASAILASMVQTAQQNAAARARVSATCACATTARLAPTAKSPATTKAHA